MTKRYPAQYALFLMAYYVTNSVYQGFLPIYYERTLGFTAAQIGSILAGFAIVSAISQPFWGTCGDRMRSKNALIRILCALSAGVILLLLFAKSYPAVLALICLFGCFYMSIQPLGDSVILESLQKNDQPFGPIRLAGGLSFAFASIAYGWALNASGKENLTIYFTAGLLGLTAIATLALPKIPGHQSNRGDRMSMARLFRMKELMLLLAFSIPMQATMGYFYTFFPGHFISLEGGNSALLGWCYFISAASEVPYLLFSDRLFRRVGVGKLMCVSAAALTARWLILATTSDYRVAMFSQVLHGWGFIVITVALAKYISLVVPSELKATGQMLLAVVSFGISRVIGNLGGGFLADALGMRGVYYIAAAICFVTLAGFAPYFLRRGPMNGVSQARG